LYCPAVRMIPVTFPPPVVIRVFWARQLNVIVEPLASVWEVPALNRFTDVGHAPARTTFGAFWRSTVSWVPPEDWLGESVVMPEQLESSLISGSAPETLLPDRRE